MFIERNEAGEITAAYANPQPGKELELVATDNAELLAFLEGLS